MATPASRLPFTSRLLRRAQRSVRFFVQRRIRGWDDSATWDLDAEIARFALPRFIRYRQLNEGMIAGLSAAETEHVHRELEWFLAVHAEGRFGELEGAELERYGAAKRLFGDHFHTLWR